ncbi:rod-binding protein [Methylocapsa palsarum]|uniref:Rod binding protein n=1 Tax=Methylocapsa palsarum TaxID=1612308 RepID=A0A1I3WAF8_9HYPH|nr:rod-binding protein [Methylocapsa palsarum]SFK04548.1 Rod binding protein [Methylocapsa palsarum]
MSIKPPSDIVLDVARAADPARSLAATAKLTRIGEDGSGAAFASVLGAASGGEGGQAELRTQLDLIGGATAAAPPVGSGKASGVKAYKGLEQLVLQHLVENLLPKDSGFFGQGSAGDIWKSMLAEQLAGQIGKSVNLGLGEATLTGPGGSAARTRLGAPG